MSNESNEHELWYFMTQQRLAKLGLDVGVEYIGEGSGMEDSVFEFSCAERYKHDIIIFAREAELKGEITDDITDAMMSAWRDRPADADEFDAEMRRLSEIANMADALIPL